MAWAERNDESFLFFVVFLVELRRVAKTQNLPRSVAGEDAVRSFGLERDDRDVPRTRPVSRRHTPARHTFERFELENGACRPDGADGRRWDCHWNLPSPTARCG